MYDPAGRGTGLGDALARTGSAVLQAGSWSARIVDELAPPDGDIHVAKHRMSGFWDTPLDSILRNLRLETLLFGGVNLDQCVLHTLADANFLGYDTILVEDCAATTNPDFCREATLLNIRQIFGFTLGIGGVAARTAGMMTAPAIAKRAAEVQAFRISPGDSNYFACLLDPLADGVSFTLVVEIFEPGGKDAAEHACHRRGGILRPGRHRRAIADGVNRAASDPAMCWCCGLAPSMWWRTPALGNSIA